MLHILLWCLAYVKQLCNKPADKSIATLMFTCAANLLSKKGKDINCISMTAVVLHLQVKLHASEQLLEELILKQQKRNNKYEDMIQVCKTAPCTITISVLQHCRSAAVPYCGAV